MIDPEILRKILKIEELPTLPEIMSKVLETVEDEFSSSRDLTEILECDHAISARVLRMANSAFYGLSAKVDSIRRAVIVIGFDAVKMLALATSVFDAFFTRQQFALDPQDFWMHSLGTAKASQTISGTFCWTTSPEACFTAGLLHDIGKLVLALGLGEKYRQIVESARENRRALRDVEMETLGTTHSEVGAWISEKWRFPPVIVDAIGHLHRPKLYVGPYQTEVAIVAVADMISRAAGFGSAGDPPTRLRSASLFLPAGLKARGFTQVVQDLSRARDETSELLGAMKSCVAN